MLARAHATISTQDQSLSDEAGRAAKRGAWMASAAIILLFLSLAMALGIAMWMDGQRSDRDRAILAHALEVEAPSGLVGEPVLTRLNVHARLPELRVGPSGERRFLEASYDLPRQPGQSLYWKRMVPFREMAFFLLPLVLATIIAILGLPSLCQGPYPIHARRRRGNRGARTRHGDARRIDRPVQPRCLPAQARECHDQAQPARCRRRDLCRSGQVQGGQ